MRKDDKTENLPVTLIEVLRKELDHVLGARAWPKKSKERVVSLNPDKGELNAVFRDLHKEKLSALCLSGGGIRSATYALGIVEALAKYKLLSKFDYLSTVSGGGYLGSWLSAWIRREQLDGDEKKLNQLLEKKVKTQADIDDIERQRKHIYKLYQEPSFDGVLEVERQLNDQHADTASTFNPATEPKQMQFLREYSNYMTPKVGLLSADTWTFLSIYLRNLLLNWTIFVPLIAAVLLIPKIMHAIILYPLAGMSSLIVLSFVAFASGAWVLGVIIKSLPSLSPQVDEPPWSTDAGVVKLAILPLLGMTFTVLTLIHWFENPPSDGFLAHRFDFPPFTTRPVLLVAMPAMVYLVIKLSIFAVGYIKFISHGNRKKAKKVFWEHLRLKRLVGTTLAAAFSGLIGGLLISKAFAVLKPMHFFEKENAELYVTFAIPLLLIIFVTTATIFVGAASKLESDGDREWLARFGAWILIACVGWISLNAIYFWGPSIIEQVHVNIQKMLTLETTPNSSSYVSVAWPEKFKAIIVPLVGIISAILTLLGGFSGASQVRETPTKSRLSSFLSFAPQIAAVIFIVFILSGIAKMTELFETPFHSGLIVLTAGIAKNLQLHILPASIDLDPLNFNLIYAGTLFSVSLIMSSLLNVNKFSLHGAYRDRLIRAYLGASKEKRMADPFTGFDDRDNFQLHRLKGQRPFHVINATLNLVDGDKLAWQNRKAATFAMTPLHCGSWALNGFRNTYEYSRSRETGPCGGLNACNKPKEHCLSTDKVDCKFHGKSLRLGTAMAISGAAVNPNMGYSSSQVVMFLMAMFNIRLGWWLGNTNEKSGKLDWHGRPYYEKPSPTLAIAPLISETFGRTDAERLFINVSDGGHFDNLGLYEMILRRCRLIIVSDGTADGEFAFDDLANTIEKCQVDLGVKIKFIGNEINIPRRNDPTDDKSTKPKERCAIATIEYPENSNGEENGCGLLIYLKPAMFGDEPVELKHYAHTAPTFPHQSTADQFYDEKQFEAYRELGFHTMNAVLKKHISKNEKSLEDAFEKITGIQIS